MLDGYLRTSAERRNKEKQKWEMILGTCKVALTIQAKEVQAKEIQAKEIQAKEIQVRRNRVREIAAREIPDKVLTGACGAVTSRLPPKEAGVEPKRDACFR